MNRAEIMQAGVDAGFGELVQRHAAEDDFSGVVLIQRGEDVIFAQASGLANRTWRVPNGLDTRFRVGSISKLFTAVAVLQLVEQGRVGLDDRITELLELREATIPPEVTVRQLLTMTGGIADWFDESGDWAADWAALIAEHPIYLLRDNRDYLPLFINKPPVAAPGERYQYNGAGYLLLGLLVEQLAGEPFFEHVRRQVLAPAGMRRSGFIPLDSVEPEVAEGYLPEQDAAERVVGWRKNIYSTTPQAAADGGATAAAADLISFAQALRSGRLLGAEMTRQALTPQVKERDEKIRGYTWMYGYGLMFLLDDAGQVVRWGHTGEEDGVSCRLYHYPTLDLDVAILSNTSWSAGGLGWALHDALLAQAG